MSIMMVTNSGPAGSNGVVILACSGAADVGAIADQAARKLAHDGAGKMHCLAGVGGKVPAIMVNILSASRILAIDGCDRNCALTTLRQAGYPLSAHVNLAELGMEKGRTPVTSEAVEKVAAKGVALIAL
jgi:uncharacterized metal-binding protein